MNILPDRNLRAFDARTQLETLTEAPQAVARRRIYGSNQRFLVAAIRHIGNLLDSDLETTLAWAQHRVSTRSPVPTHAQRIERSDLPVPNLAGRNR